MRKNWLLIWLILLCAAGHAQKRNAKAFDVFRQYITGDFDNSEQVTEEIRAGRLSHPLAVHVNRVADEKILNRPKDLQGFFILEESYYLSGGKPLELKPYLFLFEPMEGDRVRLTAFQFPAELKKEEIRNDNKSLVFDYAKLQRSTTFKGAVYEWNASKRTFSTRSPNELPGGMTFTLIETFDAETLEVMELLEKDGKRLTPYETPIVYKRRR
jgi:hypothetical protein